MDSGARYVIFVCDVRRLCDMPPALTGAAQMVCRAARATPARRVGGWRSGGLESRCVFVLRGGYLCAARRAEPIVFFEPFKLPFGEKLKGSKLLRGNAKGAVGCITVTCELVTSSHGKGSE